ncbi:MAG: nucleotide exchange factor GrpE [Myxococcota bacterium]|nr:nucleotide exchange factor GrpE [Myxococcota bacterium]
MSEDSTTDAPSEEPSSADADPNAATAAEPADPLETARAEAQRYREQLLRTAADFDNFKKRTRREMEDGERRAREDLLKDLLPVFDNLERAAQHAESASDVKSLADGISMVLRMFTDTLGRIGIERVRAVGEPFDPALHEAVQQLETTEHAPGTVAAEVQAGYRFGDRLVRPAMVVVAKPPPN